MGCIIEGGDGPVVEVERVETRTHDRVSGAPRLTICGASITLEGEEL